jgi:glycosyltransferase involved in cell wall biosynthesis
MYLANAVESALAQTYQNFEIMIVDDGSTDETPLIVNKYGSTVRYIRQDNQGLAVARNTGICNARGHFIGLLDSDDIWLPSFLEEMMLLAVKKPDGTVYYSGWRYIDSDGQILPQTPHTWVVPSSEMYPTLLRANFIIPSTVVLKRTQIIEAGSFDPSFRRLQDWELWLRLLKSGYKFVGSNECLVHYRLHSNALTTDTSSGQQAALAMAKKHFGDDDGLWHIWSEDKRRAYGGIYRYITILSIQRQGNWNICVTYLAKALMADPSLATDLDLFYDLALGTQPSGYRGTCQQLDLENTISEMRRLLDGAFSDPPLKDERVLHAQTCSTAYYALGLVAYNLDRRSLSRKLLLQAMRYYPRLVFDLRLLGLLFKSFLSKSFLMELKRVLG